MLELFILFIALFFCLSFAFFVCYAIYFIYIEIKGNVYTTISQLAIYAIGLFLFTCTFHFIAEPYFLEMLNNSTLYGNFVDMLSSIINY